MTGAILTVSARNTGLLLRSVDEKAPVAGDKPALRPDGERTEVIKVVEKQQ